MQAAALQTFQQDLMRLNFDILLEVLRAANYLDCEGLLKSAAQAVAHLFAVTCDDPEALASTLRLSSRSRMPSSVATIRPWSTVWSALVNEPVLEPPDEASLAALAQANEDEHLIRDEDALGLVLIECDVAVRCRPSRPSRRSPLPHLSPRPPDPSPIQPSQLCPSPTHTLPA